MKTVKVRIAVAVGANGAWSAGGGSGHSEYDAHCVAVDCLRRDGVRFNDYHVVWVESEVPLPSNVSVKGEVVK